MDGWLVLSMAIGDEPAKQVHEEVAMAAMTAMLNLRDVLELVDNGLDDESPTQEQLVAQEQESIPHVGSKSRDEMNALVPQRLEGFFTNISFVAKKFARKALGQGRKRHSVIGVAGSQLEGQYFPQIIDGEMQLESKKPAHGGLSTLSQTGEHFMTADALVVADPKRCRIDKTYSRTLSGQVLEIGAEGNQRGRNPFHEAVIAGQRGKFPVPMIEQRQVEMLKVPIISHMKQNQHGHDLTERHRTGTLTDLHSRAKQTLDPERFESFAEIIHVAKQLRYKVQCHWGYLLYNHQEVTPFYSTFSMILIPN